MPSTPILGITQVSTSQSGKETTINDAILALEGASNAKLTVSMAAGNVTLTDSEATRNFIFKATAATAARELKFPISVNGNDFNRIIVVRNESGYSLTVKFASGAGTTVVIPNNQSRLISAADGLNMTVAAEPPSVIAFLSLTDVPGSYAGEAGRFLAVNVAENALEFIDGAVWPDFTANAGKYLVVNETEDGVEWITAPIPEDFLDLADTPDSYTGQALKVVRVNAAGDALEFFEPEEPEAVEYVSATRWRLFALEPGVWPENDPELDPEDPEYITPTDQIGFGEIEWLDIDGIDLATGGTPTASTEESGFEAELAFDNITTGGNGWVTLEDAGGDAWIEYEFATPVVPRNVRVWSVNGAPYYSPMQFQIEYWNGTEWVNLGVRTPAAWADDVSQTFKVNGVPYDVLTEAPEDDSIYGRRNAAWIKINATVTPDATTSYDVEADDCYQYRRFTNAGSKTVNVRTDAVHALPADGEWHFHNAGVGSLTLDPDVGVTINPPPDGTLVVPEDGTVTLKRVAADTFDLFGNTVKVTATASEVFPDLTGNATKVLTVTTDETNVEWTDIEERIRDVMGVALEAGANITITPNDAGDSIEIAVSGSLGLSAEDVRDTIATALVAGTNITIDVNDAGDTITINSSGGGGGGGSYGEVEPTFEMIAEVGAPVSGVFDFTGLDLSDYDEVEVELQDIQFSVIGRPGVQFYIDGVLSTNVWHYASYGAGSGSTEANSGETDSVAPLLDNSSSNWWVVPTTTDANASYNGRLRVLNPNSTKYRSFRFEGTSPRGLSNTLLWGRGGGVLRETGTLNGFKVNAPNGTMSSGRVRIYGIRKNKLPAPTFSGALVSKAADQTGANYSTATAVAWDAEQYDEGGWHEGVTNPSRLTVPAGVTRVRVTGQIWLTSGTTADVATLRLAKNGLADEYIGAAHQAEGRDDATRRISFTSPVLEVTAGDYFEMLLGSGGDTSVTIEANASFFAIEAVGVTPETSEFPSKIGNGEKLLAVKTDESGVEWIDPPESYPDFVGNAEKVLAVNETEDGVEWVEMTGGGGGLSSAFPFSGALVYKSAAQALALSTTTNLTFNTEQYDEGGWHDTVTNNDRLVVPAGVTKVRVGARVARASATGQLVVNIRKNGSGTYTGQAQGDTDTAGTDHVTIWTPVLDVVAGDYFECTAFVDAASDIDGGAGNTWFAIEAVQMAAEANSDGQNVFRASLNTLKSNVTGAGGGYQIPYDTVNQSRSFCTLNTTTGAVTINESGTYYLESNVRFSGGSTADWLVYDIFKNGVFHKRSGIEFTDEAVVMAAVDGMIDCAAGDVITFLATVGGGTLIYDIVAADAGSNTLHITKLSTGARVSTANYPVPMGFTSAPITNEVLLLHVFNEPVDFEDDWLGSTAYVGTNPTATVTLTIGKIVAGVTTTVGTVTISTGGVVTFATTLGTVGFIAGETMIVTQTSSTDATVKNVALNFKGYRP